MTLMKWNRYHFISKVSLTVLFCWQKYRFLSQLKSVNSCKRIISCWIFYIFTTNLSRGIVWGLFENVLQSINENTSVMSCSCLLTAVHSILWRHLLCLWWAKSLFTPFVTQKGYIFVHETVFLSLLPKNFKRLAKNHVWLFSLIQDQLQVLQSIS